MEFAFNFSVIFGLILVVMARDPIRKFIRDGGKEPIGQRDYTPSKWITSSAMDVWYGNKSMIDIMWREFSDVMYKLTDRKFRSAKLEDFKFNGTQNNETILQNNEDVYNFSNNATIQYNNNSSNVSLYENHANHYNLYSNNISNISLYTDENNGTLYDDDEVNNTSLYYDNDVNNDNISIAQLLIDLILNNTIIKSDT